MKKITYKQSLKEKFTRTQEKILRQGKEEKLSLPGFRKEVKENNKIIAEMKDQRKQQEQ